MSEWWAHLEGDDSDLAYLSAVLTSSDFAIQKRNGHFYLRSVRLNKLEDALVSKKWTTRSQISRFTRTAGHPKVAGDEARHGVSTVEPPPNPMTPPEAWTFVASVLSEWLAVKQQRQHNP